MKRIFFAVVLTLISGWLMADALPDTKTTRTGITKPGLGSTGWATKTNANWDLVDSTFAALGQPNVYSSTNQYTASVLRDSNWIALTSGSPGATLGLKLFNAAVALGPGGTVDATALTGAQQISSDIVFPAGNITFLLGQCTITVTGTSGGNLITLQTGNHLKGDTRGGTVFLAGTSGTTYNALLNINPSATDIEISDLRFSGGGVTGMKFQSVIAAPSANSRIYIHDIYIDKVWAQVANIYFQNTGINNLIDKTYVVCQTTQTQHGIRIANTTPTENYFRITNSVVVDGAFGISAALSNHLYLANDECYGSQGAGSWPYVAEGFNTDSCNDVMAVGVRAWDRGDAGWTETHNESVAGSSQSLRMHLVGGMFSGNKLGGMAIDSQDSVYEDIMLFDNGSTTSNKPGINVGTGSSSDTFRSIYAFDNSTGTHSQSYGIALALGSTNTVIMGGRFHDNATGDINDNGTATKSFYYSASGGAFGFASGNVGIGTASPFTQLANTPTNYSVDTIGVSATGLLFRSNNQAGYVSVISNDFNPGAHNAGGLVINMADTIENASADKNAALWVGSGDTQRFMVSAAGNVYNTSLTSGRVPYTTTSGKVVDSSNFTFNGTTVTAAGLSSSGNLSATGLTTTTGGLLLQVSATPRSSVTPTGAGQIIFNSTDNEVCLSTGAVQTSWVKIQTPASACGH